jgi:hypothetical protein
MEFFDREARARRQTRWLLWLFGLSPLAFICVTYLLLIFVVHSIQHPAFRDHPWDVSLIVTLVYHFGEALVSPFHFLAPPGTHCWRAGSLTRCCRAMPAFQFGCWLPASGRCPIAAPPGRS